MRLTQTSLATMLLLLACAATAHHSTASYGQERVTLEGVVTAFHWVSPHVHFDVAVTQAGGEAVTWSIEATSPRLLTATGWSSTSLAPGDHVVVVATRARDPDSRAALVRSVSKADGTLLNTPGDPSAVAAAVSISSVQASCPRVEVTLIESSSSSETRPVKLGERTVFVQRSPITTTSDISEIKIAGDDVLASIQIMHTPEATARLFGATSNRDNLTIAFVVDDDVWLAFTWEGPDGIGLDGMQISLQNGTDRAKRLAESIRECSGE
jgi:hypothetical protein